MKTNNSSPWGAIQTVTALGGGIESVSTASHGGIHLPAALHRAMPAALKHLNSYSGWGSPWFEEDVEWALPCIAFPEHFDARSCYYAVQTIQAYAGRTDYMAGAANWLAGWDGNAARAKAATFTPPAVLAS